jgi:hypothetical protein
MHHREQLNRTRSRLRATAAAPTVHLVVTVHAAAEPPLSHSASEAGRRAGLQRPVGRAKGLEHSLNRLRDRSESIERLRAWQEMLRGRLEALPPDRKRWSEDGRFAWAGFGNWARNAAAVVGWTENNLAESAGVDRAVVT